MPCARVTRSRCAACRQLAEQYRADLPVPARGIIAARSGTAHRQVAQVGHLVHQDVGTDEGDLANGEAWL